MKKNYIHNVFIHINDLEIYSLADKINRFHVDVIERKLCQFDLTTQQKITIIDKILELLKLREVNGIIK